MASANFRTVKEVALAVGRPERTIRTWAYRMQIRSASNRRTRRLYVSLTDAQVLAETAEDRTHRAA